MLGGLCLSDRITLLLGLEYVGCSLFVRRHSSTHGIWVYWVVFVCQTYNFTPGTWVCWVVFVCQSVCLYSYDLSMLSGLCLSNSIALLLGLEYIGWSLFVRPYNFTPGTWVCWVVFVCQTVKLYSWKLSMLGDLCLSDRMALLLGLEYIRVVFACQTA